MAEVTYDSGYSWAVLVGVVIAFLLQGINVGCLGIMLVAFMDYFNLDKSQTAWISCCTHIAGCLCGKLPIDPHML